MMNMAAQSASSASMMKRSVCKHGVWFTVLTLLATSSHAQQATLDIQLLDNGTSIGEWHPAIINTGTNYILNDVTYNPLGASIRCYNMTIGYDPFISASVDVVNTLTTLQNYTLIFTLPISPITGGSLMGGSTQGGLTDANNDGVGTLSTIGAGTALYYGRIDGANVLPLFPASTAVSVPFAGGSTNISASAGLPGPTIGGPSVTTSIGIEHDFSLTPGDRATFTSFFVVQPVPEPACLSLLAIGGGILLFRRNRR